MNIFKRSFLIPGLIIGLAAGLLQAPAHAAAPTPQTHDEYLRAGDQFYARGLMDNALDCFTEAIKLAPADSVAYLMHGTALFAKDDFQGAVKDFTKAIELNKYEFIAYGRRGEAYDKLGRAKDADADKALAKQRLSELPAPTTAEAWFNRAEYLEDRAEYLDAIDAYSAVLKLDPAFNKGVGWTSIYERRGDLLALTLEPGEAAKDYTKAIELNAKDLELVLKRARANNLMVLLTNDSAPALKDFTTVIDRREEIKAIPEWLVESYIARAQILADKADYPAALTDIEAALVLDPKNLEATASRAYVKRRLGKPDEALVDLNTVLDRNTNSVAVWVERAGIYADKGDYAKALADYERAIALAPRDAYLRSDRGSTYFAKGDIDQALIDFSAAILLDPKLASAWNNRGASYARKEQWASAISDYTKALELDPNHRSTYQNRAIAYRKIDQPTLAAADDAKAKELEPKAP